MLRDTYVDEVYKVHILRIYHVRQVLATWHSHLSFAVRDDNWSIVVVEEDLPARSSGEHRAWWDTLDLHHQSHVVLLIFAREEWLAHVELVEDATEGPHVDGCRVLNAKHNLWCTVEATLDISVDLLILEAPRTKVDNFDAGLVNLPQQDIFRFQVTVDDVVLPHIVE